MRLTYFFFQDLSITYYNLGDRTNPVPIRVYRVNNATFGGDNATFGGDNATFGGDNATFGGDNTTFGGQYNNSY